MSSHLKLVLFTWHKYFLFRGEINAAVGEYHHGNEQIKNTAQYKQTVINVARNQINKQIKRQIEMETDEMEIKRIHENQYLTNNRWWNKLQITR